MSIEFKCYGCDNEMAVDDDMAGKRGKCPKCGRLITVPEHSETELIFSEDGFFESNELNKMLETLLEEHEDEIISTRVVGDRMLVMEVATEHGRSQIVRLWLEDDIVHANSIVGRNDDSSGFYEILVASAAALPPYPTYALFFDRLNNGKNIIGLRHASRLKNIDDDVFYDLTIQLANVADAIERATYTNDVN